MNETPGGFVGPSLWHGREVNSCTRCKYLRCQLDKSGREPDYSYYCMHPETLTGGFLKENHVKFMAKVKEKLPDKVQHFEKIYVDRLEMIKKEGNFISNNHYTPETPKWCPVITGKAA